MFFKLVLLFEFLYARYQVSVITVATKNQYDFLAPAPLKYIKMSNNELIWFV